MILANFFNEEEREAKRQTEGSKAGLIGAGEATLELFEHLPGLLPYCVLLPPLCVGVIAAGGAVGASRGTVTSVRADDADKLAKAVIAHASNDKLVSFAARTSRGVETDEFPALSLRVSLIMLVPTTEGIAFRVAASAQGFSAAGEQWEPSLHFTQTPSRSVGEWLEDDALHFKRDLDTAMRGLAYHALPFYLPHEERRRQVAAPTPPKPGPEPELVAVPSDKAAVYIYRPDRPFSRGGYPMVFVNGESKFALLEQRYAILLLPPGTYELKFEGQTFGTSWWPPPATRPLSVQARAEYFVRAVPVLPPGVKPGPHLFSRNTSRTIIELVPKELAMREMNGFKLVDEFAEKDVGPAAHPQREGDTTRASRVQQTGTERGRETTRNFQFRSESAEPTPCMTWGLRPDAAGVCR